MAIRFPHINQLYSRVLDKVTRITSSGDFIPEIDILRFIALACVVIHHLFGLYLIVLHPLQTGAPNWQVGAGDWKSYLFKLVSHGNYGVYLFFLVSGFMIGLPFARGHLGIRPLPQLSSYFARRFTRIEPPYFISLFLIYWLIFKNAPQLRSSFFASLFYLHGLLFNEQGRINSVCWSLEIEIQFYIFAPLLAQIFRVHNAFVRRSLLIIGILLMSVITAFYPSPYRIWLFTFPAYLQFFLAGFLLVDIYLRKPESTRSHWWDAVLLLAFALCFLIAERSDLIGAISLLPLPFLAICISIFRGRIGQRLCEIRTLLSLGGMCYTIYLYHCWLFNLLSSYLIARLGSSWESCAIQMLICILIGLPVFGLLFWLFERPFMKKHWLRFLRRPSRYC